MLWDHRKRTRNSAFLTDSKDSWELHPAAAREPAEGWKSSVLRNTLERSEDSFRFPRITRNAPKCYETHYFFQPSAGPAEPAGAGEPAEG